ncbi:hypothetical protein [Virgibacillus doumboii]|uniref:hypothetical protein n=1 Tax=Virgibacillus doumboii TaxID=2697503 RepID=UPI0013E057CD|nr:hypothetical protein [Virgibacillus doumboii]
MSTIKNKQTNQQQRKEIIDKLQRAGIKVNQGKKSPKNGRYSGLIGGERKKITINI